MKKNLPNQLIIKGMGACAFEGDGKKNPGGIVVVYLLDDASLDARFTVMDLPTKRVYVRQDFVDAVCDAEDVSVITYNDDENRPLDVYVCRPTQGKIEDFAARDYKNNRFASGFAGIEAANVRFSVQGFEDKPPRGTALSFAVGPLSENLVYPYGSLAFALANAFNAALLARLFTREGLFLENSKGERIHVEVVSKSVSNNIDPDTLFVRPIVLNGAGFVDGYETEAFNYVDGKQSYVHAYKIEYRNRLKDYSFVIK